MLLLAQQTSGLVPPESTWEKLAQQVPALVLFVAFAFIVFKYLQGKEERHKSTIETIVKTWTESLSQRDTLWTASIAQRDHSFLAAMKEGAERNREERKENAEAARSLAKDCHDRQGESAVVMRELAATGVRFASAAETLCDVTGRLEKVVDARAK
jgi:hypothetical protein